LKVGFLEPHLQVVGGIRRVIETGNRLVERGHEVTIYVPDGTKKSCNWMRCLPRIATVSEGEVDPVDFLIFNHEPQWYLLERFEQARHRVFFALHYGRAYEKSGSWESLRCDWDMIFANSAWTADSIEEEIGIRPQVLPSGVDHEQFRPVPAEPSYPVLCAGDRRLSKGTDVIEQACRILDVPLAKLSVQNLSQEDLAAEYCKAEVFVVGSPTEGFGFPGLEALACGVPLVTTDNGGSREYAIHEETALVVPPDDPATMAQAVSRIRSEPELRERLRERGLAMARERFSWDDAALAMEQALVDVHQGNTMVRRGPLDSDLREPVEEPLLSVIVLSWNQLDLLQRCVQSLRQHTDVPYELILVDNGSGGETPRYVEQAADVAVLNEINLGFSAGFNGGLALARGRYVCFVNSDTKMPAGWASRLAATLERDPRAGIVFPALTAAANPLTVRSRPRDAATVLPEFQEPASGVVLFMRTEQMRALGGFGEEYPIASGEDVDLCLKVWVNNLTTVLDEGVLVEHVGKASAKQLKNQERRWAHNRAILLRKWTGSLVDVPRLDTCPPETFETNKAHARGAAFWMDRYFRQRDRPAPSAAPPEPLPVPETAPPARSSLLVRLIPRQTMRRGWSALRAVVPEPLRLRLYRRYRRQYEYLFPERVPAPPSRAATAAVGPSSSREPDVRVETGRQAVK